MYTTISTPKKFTLAMAFAAICSNLVIAPMAEAAMMKKNDKMMMHKCKKGDKKCEMKMMKMKHK